jgi:predicted molibdopterin-dependent oxidoreductase YjgC
VFGSGGGTSSYRDFEATDLILLWGSNARETHPVMFLHMLRGLRNGARMVVIDPRRTLSADAAFWHLPIKVGSDIALANAMGQVILAEGLENRPFVERATRDVDRYRALVAEYTPELAAPITGIPADEIRRLARLYATAPRAVLCWTLGITEHHNATDNVYALVNLALLTGHVGRPGSGLAPLRGQNNVQGGGDMGALPDRLPGFQQVADDTRRGRFEQTWGVRIPPRPGKHQTAMMHAMERGELRCLYVIGENPVQSDADGHRVKRLFEQLDFLVVQDITMTGTGRLADVVLPGSAGWIESTGTFTNSERRVQLGRGSLAPPGEARDDCAIVQELAQRMGASWSYGSSEDVWNEVRGLAPHMFGGMSYARLIEHQGLQWPCPDESHPGSPVLHTRLWEPNVEPRVPFMPSAYDPVADAVDDNYPFVLTTGRRLEFFNTGVQTRAYPSARRQEELVMIHPDDAASYGIERGDLVRVRSRRGEVTLRAGFDPGLSRGLLFMTLHFPDRTPTNLLTIEATDPVAGTAEFKASAVMIEPVGGATPAPTGERWARVGGT